MGSAQLKNGAELNTIFPTKIKGFYRDNFFRVFLPQSLTAMRLSL